jgi:hypothetical protein
MLRMKRGRTIQRNNDSAALITYLTEKYKYNTNFNNLNARWAQKSCSIKICVEHESVGVLCHANVTVCVVFVLEASGRG